MKPQYCIDVWRDDGEPLFQVKVYDLDNPVNFHSYDCLFFKQGRGLEKLLNEADEVVHSLID